MAAFVAMISRHQCEMGCGTNLTLPCPAHHACQLLLRNPIPAIEPEAAPRQRLQWGDQYDRAGAAVVGNNWQQADLNSGSAYTCCGPKGDLGLTILAARKRSFIFKISGVGMLRMRAFRFGM